MPGVPRCLQSSEEACFHVMNRGRNREPVFGADEDRRAFIDLVARLPRPLWVLALALFPDEQSLRRLGDRRRGLPPPSLASPRSACAAWPRQAPETERARSGTIFSVSDRPTIGNVKRHHF